MGRFLYKSTVYAQYIYLLYMLILPLFLRKTYLFFIFFLKKCCVLKK